MRLTAQRPAWEAPARPAAPITPQTVRQHVPREGRHPSPWPGLGAVRRGFGGASLGPGRQAQSAECVGGVARDPTPRVTSTPPTPMDRCAARSAGRAQAPRG